MKLSPSEPTAILLASATCVAVLLGVSETNCLVRGCVDDDASIRAIGLLGMPLLFAYLLMSWMFVFPFMLGLRERLGRRWPPAIVATVCALLSAALLHRPDVDGSFLNTALALVPWLGGSWFAGGVVALTFWPAANLSD
jgi:hypothetical protein